MKSEIAKKSFSVALELLSKIDISDDIVFLCLGSKKIIFDCLAVRVADKLKKHFNVNTYVYGGSDYNITATNINSFIDMIRAYHNNSKIVVVDCALGDMFTVGLIKVYACGTAAGSAFNTREGIVGDYSVIGIIGEKESVLKSLLLTQRTFIDDMADVIAKGIDEFLRLRNYLKLREEAEG